MAEIIGIVNTKGGVSKTTTAVHLSKWLKNKDHSVIYVNASFQKGVHDWLEALEIPYHQEKDPDELISLIDKLEADYIIIDVPGASEIVRTILDYCNRVLVPVQPTALSLKDCITVITMINRKQRIRKDLIAHFFLSMIDSRSNSAKDAVEYFEAHNIKLLKTKIRQLKIIEDTPLYKSTVFDLEGTRAKTATQDYNQLFTEFLSYD